MRKFIGPWVLLAIASVGFAQDSETPSKVHHLRSAAEHLQAAGLREQAQQLREQAQIEFLRQHRELLSQKLIELEKLQHEVQSLRRLTDGSEARQIRLDIKVLEFGKPAVADGAVGVLEGIKHANALRSGGSDPLGQRQPLGDVCVVNIPIEELVQHLLKLAPVKVIAEPSLMLANGRPGTFHSGGEFPILVPAAGGKTTIDWRPFGIHLEFVATRRDDGRLALEIAPEISERDFANAVVVDGMTIPGLACCRCNTRAEMCDGQTLVLHGMRLGDKSVCVLLTPSSELGKSEPDCVACAYRENRRPVEPYCEIEESLQKQISLHFEDAPFTEVIRHISNACDINIVVDGPALEEEGLTLKSPMSISVEEIKAKSALNLLLKPLHLCYTLSDEVLQITNPSRARGQLIVMTYPVADLVRADSKADSAKIEPKDLVDLVQSTVQPESWDEVGGPASIRRFEATQSLVIRQTQDAHAEIASLLEQLRTQQKSQEKSEPPGPIER